MKKKDHLMNVVAKNKKNRKKREGAGVPGMVPKKQWRDYEVQVGCNIAISFRWNIVILDFEIVDGGA